MSSTLFSGLRRYLADQGQQGRSCRFVSEPTAEEEMPADTPTFPGDVSHVEGNRLQARSIGFDADRDGETSGFRFFLDGVQFSHLIGFVDNVPIVHHLSAAAILERDPESRELRLWRWSGPCERILVPHRYLPLEPLRALGVPAETTMDRSADTPLNPAALRALAHSKSQRMRRNLEVDLIRQWVNAGKEGYLMVDGPLMLLPEIPRRAPMAGVVKSFAAQFFEGEEQLRVATLAEAHRTTAFQLPRGTPPAERDGSDEVRRWFSWYVRVRSNHLHDTDFGLLRVEIPPDSSMLAAADEISRWVTAERAPLSTPDPRWDNLLYPIHACERYLKSALPERNRVHLLL